MCTSVYVYICIYTFIYDSILGMCGVYLPIFVVVAAPMQYAESWPFTLVQICHCFDPKSVQPYCPSASGFKVLGKHTYCTFKV